MEFESLSWEPRIRYRKCDFDDRRRLFVFDPHSVEFNFGF